MARQASSLFSTSTVQSADSVESHPTLGGIFALGTYQVTQHEEGVKGNYDDGQVQSSSPPFSRKGMLRLVQAQRNNGRITCQWLHEITMAAILDMKWIHPASGLLSVVTADSALHLYRHVSTQSRLEPVSQTTMNQSRALCLSLDWSDRLGGFVGGYDSEQPDTTAGIISQSDGTLAYVPSLACLQDDAKNIETWHAHDYEAWIAAFDCWSHGRTVWSGADDLMLKGWDMRTPIHGAASASSAGSSDAEERSPVFTHQKSFEGGVTSLQSHHLVQHLWAVGSYDGNVRLFDARNTLRPLSTTNVGGGVWRLKWHPRDPSKLLAGCMHDGFKVLEIDSLKNRALQTNLLGHTSPFNACSSGEALPREEMPIAVRFDEHESLAYGCDWDRGLAANDGSHDTVYSCSFYDAMLHAWEA